MVNKRNFLKALSSAILGTLIVGNCSNVWMMEESESAVDKNKKTGPFKILKTKIMNAMSDIVGDFGMREKLSRNLAHVISGKISTLKDNDADFIVNYIVTNYRLKLKVGALGYDFIKKIAIDAVNCFLNKNLK